VVFLEIGLGSCDENVARDTTWNFVEDRKEMNESFAGFESAGLQIKSTEKCDRFALPTTTTREVLTGFPPPRPMLAPHAK
jgi:hypothetical protein